MRKLQTTGELLPSFPTSFLQPRKPIKSKDRISISPLLWRPPPKKTSHLPPRLSGDKCYFQLPAVILNLYLKNEEEKNERKVSCYQKMFHASFYIAW